MTMTVEHRDVAATGQHQGPGPGSHDDHAGHGGHADHAEVFRRRFWWSLLLTLPIVATSEMVMEWFRYDLDFPGIELVGPVLGTVVFLWGGWPFLSGGAQELRARQPGMMLLVAMAITVAYTASMATSLGWFDLEFWWELAALVTIMLLGHWQEMKALGQAGDALAALAALLPDEAERVQPDGTVDVVPVDALTLGDLVLVRSGGRVPADGEIVEGSAELDESMITGESRPVTKAVGDRVVAGTVATDSALRVRVDAVGDETALAGIQRLVDEAQRSTSRAQVLADRAAALLFYVAAGAAVVTFVAWSVFDSLDEAVVRVVTVLVISCPHALGSGHPAGDRHLLGQGRGQRDPGEGPAGPRAEPDRRGLPVRQDRHADQGRAHGGRRRRHGRDDRGRGPRPRRRGRGGQRAPAGPGHRGGRAVIGPHRDRASDPTPAGASRPSSVVGATASGARRCYGSRGWVSPWS